jgi:hypothetical protein
MLNIQYVISLEQFIKLPKSLPFIHDKEDRKSHDSLGYIQSISKI